MAVVSSYKNSISITVGATLAKKSLSFLTLAKLVFYQYKDFFAQIISTSLRKRVFI